MGRSVQLADVHDDTFCFDSNVLSAICKKIGERKVSLVSVSGPTRSGKSFLLNFFLGFMNQKSTGTWLEDQDDVTERKFHWRGGSERNTTGIWIWDEPFIVKRPEHQDEIAVLFIDTQGVFDTQASVKENTMLFAFSTLISSVQIYNLPRMISESDLMHLELFVKYGELALEGSSASSKPFQNLTFLIRDWSWPRESKYGYEGGRDYLARCFQERSSPNLTHQHVQQCFDALTCFLMPHPGFEVTENEQFEGRLPDIRGEFKTQLKNFVPSLLTPSKLLVKKIAGEEITGRGLFSISKKYADAFTTQGMPIPKTIFESTAEFNHQAAVSMVSTYYMEEMDKIIDGKNYIPEPKLESEHRVKKERAFEAFDAYPKMGSRLFGKRYRDSLEERIEKAYANFQEQNRQRTLGAAVRRTWNNHKSKLYTVAGVAGVVGALLARR
ncbi:atlastin-2-like [Oscarella lobularis]|uniref:atlastin-2-like n=1 Tax=Oscarella lobularis TaxID=121494 RepID=UPI003313D924